MEGTRKRLSGQLAQITGREVTGHVETDLLVLRLYQAMPIEVRRADRLGVWRKCFELALATVAVTTSWRAAA